MGVEQIPFRRGRVMAQEIFQIRACHRNLPKSPEISMLRPAQSEIESNKGRILRAGFQMPMVGLISVTFDAKSHKI